ncbi:MAG: DUF1841 family protein [Chloroflexi bacterium]|nr:DUF1841 family protein [Chloroflexota bacterium]
MSETAGDVYESLRNISQRRFRALWEAGKLEVELSDEDQRLVKAMQDHPQYRQFWEQADRIGEEELAIRGENPFLHVMVHVVIENQLALRDPPEVYEIFQAKLARGQPRHEVCHEIARVLMEFVWQALRYQKPFDAKGYADSVRDLDAKMDDGHARRRTSRPRYRRRGRR